MSAFGNGPDALHEKIAEFKANLQGAEWPQALRDADFLRVSAVTLKGSEFKIGLGA